MTGIFWGLAKLTALDGRKAAEELPHFKGLRRICGTSQVMGFFS
jgi:hypothetical protein